MVKKARLVLEDGTVFQGELFGSETNIAGEVVFNTGMVGYPESLTDPSYRGQILVLTYPLVGNYGVPAVTKDELGLPLGFESERIQIAGLIVSEHAARYSHYTAVKSLGEWLREHNVPGISEVDTRAITKRLREHGTMLGKIELSGQETGFVDPNVKDLVSEVSPRQITEITGLGGDSPSSPTVVVVDCGCKTNILRSLLLRGLNVVRVPHDYYFLDIDFDGVLISNGPGDPRMCPETVRNIEHAIAVGKPILGICLGHQLLSLAVGAETYKLRFGHRSQNQPCLEQTSDKRVLARERSTAVITSQNHGYAVREAGMPQDWQIWFKNANDGTVEGIRHISKPFFGVQFHPEATPGPVDTAWIFDEFASLVRERIR